MNAGIARLLAAVGSDRRALTARLSELGVLDLRSGDEGSAARAALALHHAYGAVEAILERVARTIEGEVGQGPEWHRELLESAAEELPGVRPPLLTSATVIGLHELLAFRHFLRHGYGIPLDPARLDLLCRRAGELRAGLEADLDRLEAWLRSVGEESGR